MNNIQNNDSLTVVMPTYNELSLIESAIDEVVEKILHTVPNSKLLIMDGGSSDGSVEVIERLAEKNPQLLLISQPGSKHGPSLISGMNMSTAEYLFLIDSDMQIPLDCFSQIWALRSDYDIVLGTRLNRKDPWQRLAISFIARSLIQLIFFVKLTDANAPCKLIKRSVWNELYNRMRDDELSVPSLFISIFSKTQPYRVVEIPVSHKERASGQAIRLSVIFKTGARVAFKLVKYRKTVMQRNFNSQVTD